MNNSKLYRAIIDSAAAMHRATTRLHRPKTLSVFCEHCSTWVKSRRYNPVLYCCNTCEPTLAAGNGSAWRTAQQAAELTHRLHVKRTRQWRRQTATARESLTSKHSPAAGHLMSAA